MENGQKTPINLEAGLDISTSDMLVPLSQQTFQHNWQKYQGKYLPNSLRFEKNGWAAGWNVFNFKYNVLRKAENGYYLGLGQFNSNTKTINVYADKDSFDALHTVYVVPESMVTVGSAEIVDNKIIGNIKGKSFELIWDAEAHSLSTESLGIKVEYKINNDYSISIVVSDTDSSYTFDFDILLSSNLVGDAIESVEYSGFDGTVHSWSDYKYNSNTNKVTTPTGMSITPNVEGNCITFDYSEVVNNERETVTYSMDKFYPRFNNISWQDQSNNEKFIFGNNPSEKLAFNRYIASVSPRSLVARDEAGIIIDYSVPVWIVASMGVTHSSPKASKCNNVSNYEVATMHGTGLKMSGKAVNVYTGNSVSININDEYRPNSPKYINGLEYRFNQIFLDNTIEPSSAWDQRKVLLNNEVWLGESRKYKNIREKNIVTLGKLLGDVYTYGNFTYNANDYFDYNNPFDWSNELNIVYTESDISSIMSVKLKGTPDNVFTYDDENFVQNNLPSDIIENTIAKCTESVIPYSNLQAAKEYDELYDDTGKYIGGTYEDASVMVQPFWPFEKVPKFNFKDLSGNIHYGVYWTDGTDYIDSISAFKEKVLGDYDGSVELINKATRENVYANRTRIVKCFKAGYDFNFIKQSDYSSDTEYAKARIAWNDVWKRYYGDMQSPQDKFDEGAVSDDDTYLDYVDVDVIMGCNPEIKYVTPGVYIFDKWAVPYNCSSGLIIYDDSAGYDLSANIWHHSVPKDSRYDLYTNHLPGHISFDGNASELPFYFGKEKSESLVEGQYSASFTQNSERCKLASAHLFMAVNYEAVRVHHDGGPEGTGYYTIEWWETEANSDCWLRNLLVSYDTGSITCTARLNDNVEQVRQYQFVGDINEGVKFAWPVWSHSRTRLTYPEMMDLSHINDKEAFILETVPTSELENVDLIYFDRNDTSKSLKLFNVVESSREPDSGNNKGKLCITLSSDNDSFLYYARKQVDQNNNEIFYPYYIPGIAWGDPNSSIGNMEIVSEYPILELDWNPVVRRFPVGLNARFSNLNTRYLRHRFFTKDYLSISNPSFELLDIDIETLTRNIMLHFKDGNILLHYDSSNEGTTSVSIGNSILDNEYETVVLSDCASASEVVTLPLAITLKYNNNKACFVKLSDYELIESDGNMCTISNGTSEIVYSIQQQQTVIPGTGATTVVNLIDNGQHVNITGMLNSILVAYLKAVYDGFIEDGIVSFNFKDKHFTFDINNDSSSDIDVLSTDIREPAKTKAIGKIQPNGQYQFLKQQWNSTVEVEDFWWVDSSHILELNQFNFVLKRNTQELDDWNGNRFEKIYELNRGNILPSDVLRYFVTNVYKSKYPAMLVTVKEDSGQIVFTAMNPRKNMHKVLEQRVVIKCKSLGQVLNDKVKEGNVALFNTYNPLTVGQVVSKADWSSTIVDHYLIIGCHVGNNFDQWSFVIDLQNGKLHCVLQGYGYVGLHGELTGGQIPNDYYDVDKGFSDTVQPLSILNKVNSADYNDIDGAYETGDVNKVNNIDANVVGTSEQQWYIKSRLYGIVSHLTFSDGVFTKHILPITNNYASVYKSPSWSSSVCGDMMVQVTGFSTMMQFDGAAEAIWQSFMTLLGQPMLYSIAPRFSQIAYLQQTFGQYAYVHYNSSKSMPEQNVENSSTDSGINEKKNLQTDPVLSASFTFDKQKFTQNARTELDTYRSILYTLIATFCDSLQVLDKKQSVNEEQNQSAVSDVGKKFVDNAVANTGDMLASAIVSQSKTDSGVTSVVTGLKSLDMFYSTSDQQRVFAGPGFVEHQFVADCVAQSVTDTQVEGKVQMLYLCIRALTTLQLNLTIKLEELAADALDKAADATAAQMVCGTSLGAVAVGMHGVAAGMRAAVAAQKNALQEIEKILDTICSKGITVTNDGAIARHALSVEGKHKYGEKNESFMWPCWGIQPGQLSYTDEYVDCGIKNTPWTLTLKSTKYWKGGNFNIANIIMHWDKPRYSSNKMGSQGEAVANCGDAAAWNGSTGNKDFGKPGDTYRAYYMEGRVPFYQAAPFGRAIARELPDDMACVEGVSRFLPDEPFKNENIGVSEPAFAPSLQQDYIIDKAWDLAQYCTYGKQQWVTVKDTKIIDCPPSNIVITNEFCGVACPYTAIEVKRGIEKAYMRPWAVTPNTLAFNCTGYNSILDNKLYHAFDGISYRLVNLIGSPGMNKSRQSFLYAFQVNDRFKRSNKVPANELQGNFESEPVMAVNSIDKLWSLMTVAAKEKGLEAGTVGEDKDLIRWAIPVFTEHVSTLPAAVKTLSAMTLGVVEGVTSLCVDLANNQTAYKAPLSVDFTIGKQVYRATEEYICSVQTQNGVDVVTDLIPALGLKFIGATPTEAYFYSKSTRAYYSFTGGSLVKMDMMERFRDVQKGYWDFVNQEVVMPCLMTFKRLNDEIEDKDTETDNIIVPVLSKNQVSGELPPPITTIFNDRSWYKIVSLPSGLAYQGPNRVIINRNVFVEYMLDTLKSNLGKWNKVSREKYTTQRIYSEVYSSVMKEVKGVDGWTHNQFVLVTSALGNSEDTDCLFEWTITFCWPVEMELIYGVDNYAVVNIAADTMTPGGKIKSVPTHVFLTKELFTRDGNYGYYSFTFQSKNGAGNRERLHIWSDQYIAVSSISCESKVVTSKRTSQLTQQIDVQKLKEL